MNQSRRTDTSTEFLVALLGGAILGYVLGASTVFFRYFPYPQIIEPWFAPLVSMRQRGQYPPRRPGGAPAWQPIPEETKPVVEKKNGAGPDQPTFYTSGRAPEAFLVNGDGEKLHHWKLPFDTVWPQPTHVTSPAPSADIYWRDAELLSNGDLVAIYAVAGEQPPGHGLIKIDRRSRLRWAYPGRTHSDIAVNRDGEVFALELTERESSSTSVRPTPSRRWSDSVVHLTSGGRVETKISLFRALADSAYREVVESYPKFIDSPTEKQGGILDARSIEVVGRGFARHHEFVEPGHLLVSLSAPDAIGLLDPQRRRFVWLSRGVWWRPSDADALSDGDLLVFDRAGHGGPGLPSRIVRFDLETGSTTWQYTGTKQRPLWSQYGGSQQLLANGHVLITLPMTGEIREITPQKQVHWSYRNPARTQRNAPPMIATLWAGRRIEAPRIEWLSDTPLPSVD